jgi:hypothetical protein
MTVLLPPPALPVVLSAATVQECATPVAQRCAELAAAAVTAADLTPERLAGVYCIGGTAALPPVPAAIGERLGVPVQVLPDPGFVAVLGAAQAGAHAGPGAVSAPPDAAAEPAWRRSVSWAVPGVASLALLLHALLGASFQNGTRQFPRVGFYVLVAWGELAMAALFALVACLGAGSFFAAALAHDRRDDARTSPGSRVAGGILAAAASGAAIAGMYGVLAGFYLRVDVGRALGWTLWPVAPVAVIAVVVAVVAARGWRTPVGGWDGLFGFSPVSVLTAAAGMAMMQYSLHTARPPDWAVWIDLAGRGGGVLFGVGLACALVATAALRLVVAVPVTVFVLLIAGTASSTEVLGVIYTIAVTVWYARRLWGLLRSPVRASGHAT